LAGKCESLKDAEKCVELAPTWSKGYNRLGAAQQGLKRFEAAIESFKKSIELDSNNQSLCGLTKKNLYNNIFFDENQKLIGSPPGYVGHDEGGQLVNLVKRNPYTVVLLDEVEKAHVDMWNTFLRVFEDGVLTDGKGEEVSFLNTVIIMTTNLGNEKTVDYLLSGGTGFAKNINHKTSTTQMPAKEMVEKNTLDAVRKHFRPEFINRLDKIIVFNHLDRSNLEKIAELEMSIIMDKLSKKGYSVNYTDEVISALLDKGVDSVKGARGLAQVRREKMEDQLADILIKS
jgi:ATP-dependent Clp protease ATP-binding subunit ClpC